MRNQLDIPDLHRAAVEAEHRSTAQLFGSEERRLFNRSVVEHDGVASGPNDKALDAIEPRPQSFDFFLGQPRIVILVRLPVNSGVNPNFTLNRRNVARQPCQSHTGFGLHRMKSRDDRGQLVHGDLACLGLQPCTDIRSGNELVSGKNLAIKEAEHCSYPDANMRQLAAQETKKHLLLSLTFSLRLCVESAPLLETVCQSDLSHFVGFLPQHKHRKSGERGDANANGGNYHSEYGYHHRPRIPPHHAICNAWFHARADSVPQLLQPTHSLIPLWTRRHSAMPSRRAENCHG